MQEELFDHRIALREVIYRRIYAFSRIHHLKSIEYFNFQTLNETNFRNVILLLLLLLLAIGIQTD